MNTPSAGLSAYDLAGMTATVRSLVVDEGTATTITFTANDGGRGYDPATGGVTYAETVTSVSAWLSPITLEEIPRIEGAQVGDVQVLIAVADLATAPDTGARFRADDIDYRIYNAGKGPVNTHYLLYASRVK